LLRQRRPQLHCRLSQQRKMLTLPLFASAQQGEQAAKIEE
jgi:hypothetical protein